MINEATYFLNYQKRWIKDQSLLKIIEKGRQLGVSYSTAYCAVARTALRDNKLDNWVSSRDDTQAKLFLEDAKKWGNILNAAARDLGEIAIDKESSAYVLEFANGKRIYSLSSNPNALAGKRGNVTLDEFALHKDQRLLYAIAKPVTQWGGQLEIISTHRGVASVFNQLIREILEKGNPMGWSHHKVPIQRAVDEGLVAKINEKTGRNESNEDFLARMRAGCIDQEQWLQEYCCIPADDNSAFLSYDLINSCTSNLTMKDLAYVLKNVAGEFYLGVDVARKKDLCVFDLGEKIGDVVWDRLRIELQGSTFAEIEFELYRLLALPQVKRCCIDATGLGMQLAERAKERFGWKVEPCMFTQKFKEAISFPFKADFEDRRLRIDDSQKLIADLRGIKKETTAAGNIRFEGDTEDSHCDRYWAKALRQHAVSKPSNCFAIVVTE